MSDADNLINAGVQVATIGIVAGVAKSLLNKKDHTKIFHKQQKHLSNGHNRLGRK